MYMIDNIRQRVFVKQEAIRKFKSMYCRSIFPPNNKQTKKININMSKNIFPL